jgi:hypothetical protein
MHCPNCGVVLTEQSVYCHKCGARIDIPAPESSPDDQPAVAPPPDGGSPADRPEPEYRQRPATPAERFRDNAAARPGGPVEPEKQLWQGRFSSKAMIGAWALSGLSTLVLLIVWIAWLRNYWIIMLVLLALPWLYSVVLLKFRQWNCYYQLTNQRFIHHTGILRRVTDRIEVIDMDDITFEQKLLERFVGVGTIRITSSDRTHPELLLRGIENVKEVAGQIDDTRRAERLSRGLHIESI